MINHLIANLEFNCLMALMNGLLWNGWSFDHWLCQNLWTDGLWFSTRGLYSSACWKKFLTLMSWPGNLALNASDHACL